MRLGIVNFSLANEFLNKRSNFFSFLKGSCDSLVFHEAGSEIAHKSQSVIWHTTELSAPHFVSHF